VALLTQGSLSVRPHAVSMSRIYEVGIIHQKVTKNPVEGLETSTKSNYRAIKISPAQTLSILRSMMQNILHFTLVCRDSTPFARN